MVDGVDTVLFVRPGIGGGVGGTNDVEIEDTAGIAALGVVFTTPDPVETIVGTVGIPLPD
jgi:hypothetical protein